MAARSAKSSPPTARVALGISGGIAAYKAAEILRGLQRAGCEIRVAMTKRACEFVQPLTFRALSGAHVIVDDYAPDNPDPIAHITFSQSVDLFVIAPATANVIAKMANGIADDFLTATYLASNAPVLVAPAMNTSMWHHPATQRNIQRLREDGVRVLDPDEGEMACGTVGPGRLSDPEAIVSVALDMLRSGTRAMDLKGENFLITTGATREEIDPVRFISNRSSGRMGFAIAEAAERRGATVTVVKGATSVQLPKGVRAIEAISADAMHEAVMNEIPKATVFVAAAAVADYKPVSRSAAKMKKNESTLTIELERTPDILKEVAAAARNGQLIIGFAAETENLVQNARQKLVSKRLHMIVANDVSQSDAGFDADQNRIVIIRSPSEPPIELPLMAKTEAAHKILDAVLELRQRTLETAASQG
ncbi:MAG TPA: bifunctional phosphopantothenoylcysteine decarboxylase/phosphopantothenate--cysteine ligase CoaBC [Pyrinomonadaceae bacterium]|nr:bifunctional phosphopantothenoylcysteine decarboxylase/phosphopantothenate--cysteine ligase CoaBC [Pyrinomonadaceae bacterium]